MLHLQTCFFFLKAISSSYKSDFRIYLSLLLCPLISWGKRNYSKVEPWSEDGSLLYLCKGRAALCPALYSHVLASRQDGSRRVTCQDCPSRPSFPLEISIQRKQQWLSGLLMERHMLSLPKSKMSTNFAEQFAPWWENHKLTRHLKKNQQTQTKENSPTPPWMW